MRKTSAEDTDAFLNDVKAIVVHIAFDAISMLIDLIGLLSDVKGMLNTGKDDQLLAMYSSRKEIRCR